jgi:predicted DNA-binding transcriptional regulator YafY
MDPDSTPSEKLIALYSLLLFSGRKFSLGDLAEKLHCSKQTVMRLTDRLESAPFGKLIRSRNGREALYEIGRPRLPKISLNAEGLQQLALCRNFILHLLPAAMREQMEATLQQASGYVPEGEDADIEAGFAQPLFKGRIDYSPFQDSLRKLTAAIRGRKICEVTYKAPRNKEKKSFAYSPKRLIAFHEAIYINGWVMDGGRTKYAEPTPLVLQRILHVEPTQRSAARLPDPPDERGEAFGLMDREVFRARIRFEAKAAAYVQEREWSAGQQIVRHRDGGITLTLQFRSPLEVIAWALSFGAAAEVLAPAWLRQKMAEQAAALAGLYGACLPGLASV